MPSHHQRLPDGKSVLVGKTVYLFDSPKQAREFEECLDKSDLAVCEAGSGFPKSRPATPEELHEFNETFKEVPPTTPTKPDTGYEP